MADQVIDKLIFALGGDLSDLEAAYKQAEVGAKKTGTSIQQNLGQGFKDAAGQAAQHAGAINKNFGDLEKHSEKLGMNINVSRRELVYFVRELATGDIQRMPATFALLASHILELSPAAILAGAAIAAIPIAVTVAAFKADAALSKLRTSIALTGNASGISLSQATTASAAAAAGGNLSQMGAEKIMGGLIGAGVPAQFLGRATAAAGNYALGTGSTQEQAIEVVKKIFEEPGRSADEFNKSMHLLTVEQTEQVKNLADSGQTEKAADIILQQFSDRTKEAAESASMFSKAVSNAGNFFGNIAKQFQLGVGGGSAQEKLDLLNGPAHLRPFGVFQDLVTPRAGLEAQVAKEAADAKAKGDAARANEEIGTGYADAKRGADAFAQKLNDLQNELNRDAMAARAAGETHSKFAGMLETQRATMEKVVEATRKFGSPEAQAAQRLADARQMAGTSLEDQPIVQARQQAQARYRENLQSPETAGSAAAILKMDLAAAGLAGANKAKEQEKNLQVMQQQAVAAERVARAYDVSTMAAERAKAEGEVDVEVTNRQIAAKDRLAAITAKVALAYATADQAIGREINTLKLSNAGLAGEAAAGGNPAAIAAAKRAAEADQAVQGLSPEDAARRRAQLLGQYQVRDQAQGRISANADIFSARQDLGNLRGRAGAFAAGISDDDLRRLQVAQDTLDSLVKTGLDPASQDFKDLYNTLLPLNTQVSDLNDSFAKMQQEAKGMANAITGSLGNFLSHPGQVSPLDAAADAGQGVLNQLVQTQILDPMNKWLTSQFAGMLGSPTELGASPANAMWVQSIGGGGGGGGGLGGLGGLGESLFGNAAGIGGLFGSSPATLGGYSADAMGAGSLAGLDLSLPDLGAFAGLFDSGGTIGPGQWGVKSGKPEIVQGGTAGVSILPFDAPVVRAAIGSQAPYSASERGGDMHFHLPNVTDTTSFIRSKSQIAAAITTATSMGRRNK